MASPVRPPPSLMRVPPSGTGVALRSPLRWTAILSLVVAGAIHIPVTPEHLREAPYIGALFIALTVVCLALALTMLLSDTAGVWGTAGGVTALAFAAYAVSRTVGLPQIGDDVGNWLEPLGIAAVCAEGVTFLAAATVLAHHATRR